MLTDLERPAPYRVADSREWIVCDDPGMEGLAILVRTSITNAEQRALRARVDDLSGDGAYAAHWRALKAEDKDLAQSPWARQKALLAAYVLDWNAVGMTVDGEEGPLPPPAVAGAEAFDCVSDDEVNWILSVVMGGYLVTGKAGLLPRRSGPTGDSSAPETDPATPERKRPARRKS